jgi:Bacterial Ig-like domain (group 3)/FG-GAP-like repeat
MVPQFFLAPKTCAFRRRCRASLPLLAKVVLLSSAVVPCFATVTNQFLRLTSYPTGGTPARMAAADFNRDGKADVVVLNSNGVLSFAAGNGAGAFSAPKTIATLPAASASSLIAAGDFNGDGNQDVVLLPPPGNAVQVFAGHGDGTFAAPVTISDGLASAAAMASGDFNNDGKPDIAVAGATAVSVLLGNGTTLLAKATVTTTGLNDPFGSMAIALGDVNRDSHLDVAVNDQNGNFQILFGSSTGALHPQAVTAFSTGFPPNAIAIADFNGDGKPDMAAGEGLNLPQFFTSSVCIFDGNGDGTFADSPQTCIGEGPDTFTDMVVTNLNGKPGITFPSDPLMMFVNTGNAAFSETDYAAGGPLALADFNGDGLQDMASGTPDGVQVVINAGGGIVRAPLSLARTGGSFTFAVGMNSADMNRDGYADLILDDFFDEHSFLEPSLQVLLGGPRNTFTHSAGTSLNFTDFSEAVNPPAIGDFNHDGLLDIAYSAIVSFWDPPPAYTQIIFGDGKGGLSGSGPAMDTAGNYLAAGYFNAGGIEDLASVDSSGLSILLGNGDGTFAPAKNFGVGNNPVFVLQRDLNGDGKRDVVVVNHDSDTVSVLLGNGDGTFKPQVAYAAGTLPNTAVTGDFNRDGKVDIAVGSSTGVSILLGNGNGTFQAQKLYSATGAITGLVQASVRQDGNECLLGIDSATNRFVLLPGLGNGTFAAPVFYPVDKVPSAIVAADFDRDGATDIVLLLPRVGVDTSTGQPIGGNLTVFYNQGGDHVTLASSSATPKAGQPVTLTAHVGKSWYEAGTPGGTVTFKEGTKVLGTVAIAGGAASLNAAFAAGAHSIVANYSGDANFNPNHSATVTVNATP